MAKVKTSYICVACGETSGKWLGKCVTCGGFNTFVEQEVTNNGSKNKLFTTSNQVVALSDVQNTESERFTTKIDELDRVLSGGVVRGSLCLIGGDPGVGKSTLLLQLADNLDGEMLYVSGEESLSQIKLRANRLGVKGERLKLLSETNFFAIEKAIMNNRPDFVIIDSIQTVYNEEISSSAGSVTQTRECVNALMKIAKNENITVFVVGHVTKDGMIAGPKTLEHMVDTVIYFVGDSNVNFRIIRAVKNRFGSVNEIGVFEMGEKGLIGIENPSQYLLSGRPENIAGSVVTCSLEGSRPILIEVQALVVNTNFGNPRRTATGIDLNRVQMLIAVLEKRVGLNMSQLDCYINVVGGLKVQETAVDTGLICAIASSFKNRPIKMDTITFGEVGLTGEVRAVTSIERRITESIKLGFKKIVIPTSQLSSIKISKKLLKDVEIIGVENARDLIVEVLL